MKQFVSILFLVVLFLGADRLSRKRFEREAWLYNVKEQHGFVDKAVP